MKVGLTLYGDLDERSGGFRYDRKLVEHLRAAGDEVEVISLPWRSYPRGLLDGFSPRLRDRLSVDVDVMLQDELAHPSLVRHNPRLPYPVVSVVHHLRASEDRALSPLYEAIEARYLATVDGVVCNSTATSEVVHATGVDPERTVVAPPAGDRFDPDAEVAPVLESPPDSDPGALASQTREGPLEVAFVGNVAPRKGLDVLVEGVARADSAIDLTVVGRPADEEYVRRVREQVDDLDLGDRVAFAGELSDAELEAVLRAGDCLAVPSRYEGFGIVYLEGMSFGLPAIASAAGGAEDVVSDGETGFLVDPGDAGAVADALDALASDRERLVRMGRAARKRYENHPDWAESTARVRSLLAAVAADHADGTVSEFAEVSP